MDIHFIVMPFASVHRPAIGVSLLKAALKDIGVSSKIHYFNLKFAEHIGLKFYDRVAETEFANPSLVGELIFARSAFERTPWKRQHIEALLNHIFNGQSMSYLNNLIDEIIRVEGSVPEFLNECVSEILLEKPKLVGFTSTFHQNCASLSLAKLIKQEAGIPIIFGGANCEGEMGSALLNSAPWIDFICSGEGDIAFMEFIKCFLKGKNSNKINGIITRETSTLDIFLTNPVMDMDCLQFPDFDDYFTAGSSSSIMNDLNPNLVIETSRGCWWGEKFQCTFCGLNGSTMKYRSKSIPRVLRELEYLMKRYKKTSFNVVDNILDLKYIDGLFPEIFRRKLGVELFYETKSNISKKQVITMYQGGVRAIQPGIESLSDSVLKIMKKGVSALQNIELLKWCREIGIVPHWNLIWGFPGEPEEEYYRMAEIVPLITHLPPPGGSGKIVLDRFSPYFLEPLQNGMINVRPAMAYMLVYPFPEEYVRKIAYHFDFDYSDGRDPISYVKELLIQIENWKKLWNSKQMPSLNVFSVGNLMMINDTRPCSVQGFQLLANEKAKIYEICETIHNLRSIFVKLQEYYPLITEKEIDDLLSLLVGDKLMLCDNDRYLSLAIPVTQ